MTPSARIIAAVLALIAACTLGCAETMLRVELAIFDGEEPPSLLLSLEQVAEKEKNLEEVLKSGRRLTEDRIELSHDVVRVFSAYQRLMPEFDDRRLDPLRRQRRDYEEQLRANLASLEARIAAAHDAAELYERYFTRLVESEVAAAREAEEKGYDRGGRWREVPHASSIEALRREVREHERILLGQIALANSAARELEDEPETDFSMVELWPRIERSLDPKNMQALLEIWTSKKYGRTATEFYQMLDSVRDQVAIVADRIAAIAPRYGSSSDLVPAAQALATPVTDDASLTALSASLRTVVARGSTLTSGFDAAGRTALADLSRNVQLTMSQIDRLQDAGDPVWRRVTAAENGSQWNTEFSKTYFYAEGDSSVVIVRDNPMAFRVQRGNNNPAALVRGQLTVSRAIADAAITVAGAAAGVPTGDIVPDPPDQAGAATTARLNSPTDGEIEASQTLAGRRVVASEAQRSRLAALRALDRNLSDILKRLEEAKDDKTRDAQYLRLQGTLQAIGRRFEPAKPDTSGD